MIDINERMDALNTLHNNLPSGVVIELLDRLEAAESDALEQARLNGVGASREAALMAKLEAAEKEVAHIKEVEFPRKVRAVAVGWETKCARLEQERDTLRAKVEAAEKDIALKERIIDSLGSTLNAVSNERDVLRDRLALESQENGALRDSVDRACEERDALRAKIEAMEKQGPAGTLHDDGHFVWSTTRPYESNYAGWKMKLYLAPGAQPTPSIPAGWKLVPIEPTHEMLEAGEGALVPTYTDTPVSVPFDVYRAMLAAAPEANP